MAGRIVPNRSTRFAALTALQMTSGLVRSTIAPVSPPRSCSPGVPPSRRRGGDADGRVRGALGQNRLDDAQASADAVLAAGEPTGPGKAERLYARPGVRAAAQAPGPARRARGAPQRGPRRLRRRWALKPPPKLEASVRGMQLANVAYFQEDFTTAVREGGGVRGTGEPGDQSWVLYRVGLSQQRLGRFAEADQAFAAVQQRFSAPSLPAAPPATRAPARSTSRSARSPTPPTPQRTVSAVQADGFTPLEVRRPHRQADHRGGPCGRPTSRRRPQARPRRGTRARSSRHDFTPVR